MLVRLHYVAFSLFWFVLVVSHGMAQEAAGHEVLTQEELQLLQMTPEELLNVTLSPHSVRQYWEEQGVTTASKKGEDPFDTPSAVYVISQEDIQRSGATNLPDILRMAPGIQVAQIDTNKWAVTARGGNRQFTGQLLVLIDGRNIYTPIFSGVFWDLHFPILNDIERIEVVRGPGATIWGDNAVNGVINIITKHSSLTQGAQLSALVGNVDKHIVQGRYGGTLDNNTTYRMYAKKSEVGHSYRLSGGALPNGREHLMGGMRVDTSFSKDKALMFQLNSYYVDSQGYKTLRPVLTSPFVIAEVNEKESYGGNVITKYIDDDHDFLHTEINASINYDIMHYSTLLRREDITFDVDFQQTGQWHDRHELTWGAGFRIADDKTSNSVLLGYDPEEKLSRLYTAFLQDKFTLIPRVLHMTLGSKFEYTEFTDFEYQPSARISWFPGDNQTFWAAVSRAVRVPTRFERGGVQKMFGTSDGFIALLGNEEFDSEELIAYEVGYRIKPTAGMMLDITAFHNIYDKFGVFSQGESFNDLAVPLILESTGEAEVNGVELALQWQLHRDWRLEGAYSFLDANFEAGADTLVINHDHDPKHQFNVRSLWNVSSDLQWDNSVYFVDSLHVVDVEAYTRWDSRLAWQLDQNIDLQFVIQNILDDRHQEFPTSLHADPSEIGRSFYVQYSWEF